MSLQQWLDNAWVIQVEASGQDVANLVAIARREIADASLEGISTDGRFVHAYDAVRSLCEAALHASGFRVPKGGRKHERDIESLKFTLGGRWANEVDFFDRCRRSRHKTLYERIGLVQQKDADDLLQAAKELLAAVETWLQSHHPALV